MPGNFLGAWDNIVLTRNRHQKDYQLVIER